MSIFLFINAIVCLILSVVWGTESYKNKFLKLVLFALGLASLFFLGLLLGYVVKL
jgi:hypothetical protein